MADGAMVVREAESSLVKMDEEASRLGVEVYETPEFKALAEVGTRVGASEFSRQVLIEVQLCVQHALSDRAVLADMALRRRIFGEATVEVSPE